MNIWARSTAGYIERLTERRRRPLADNGLTPVCFVAYVAWSWKTSRSFILVQCQSYQNPPSEVRKNQGKNERHTYTHTRTQREREKQKERESWGGERCENESVRGGTRGGGSEYLGERERKKKKERAGGKKEDMRMN